VRQGGQEARGQWCTSVLSYRVLGHATAVPVKPELQSIARTLVQPQTMQTFRRTTVAGNRLSTLAVLHWPTRQQQHSPPHSAADTAPAASVVLPSAQGLHLVPKVPPSPKYPSGHSRTGSATSWSAFSPLTSISKASAAFKALLTTPEPDLTKQSVTTRCAEGASDVVRPWLHCWQGLRLPLAE
jgi:hypothetical protein